MMMPYNKQDWFLAMFSNVFRIINNYQSKNNYEMMKQEIEQKSDS